MCKKSILFVLLILSLNASSGIKATENNIHIPVVDMRDFYNPEKQELFIRQQLKLILTY